MTDRQVTDWQRSGPEPGKDYEDIWYDTQKVRGDGYVESHGVGRLNVLDPQVQIRRTPDFSKFPRRP